MILVKSTSRNPGAQVSITGVAPILSIKRTYLWALLALLFSLLGSASVVTAESPTEGYFRFQQGVSKATTLQEALPYLSPEYRAMLESRPPESHAEWLERLKNAANKSNVKVIKETINGKSAVLEATGTDSDGAVLKGKISLVNEKGVWLLDEQGWSS